MPFIVPPSHQKNGLSTEIDSTLKNIQLSVDSLNKRLDKLEHSQRDSYQAISRLEQHTNKDNKPDSSFGGLILLVIIIAGIVFGFHFGTFLLRLMLSISISTKKSLLNKRITINPNSCHP